MAAEPRLSDLARQMLARDRERACEGFGCLWTSHAPSCPWIALPRLVAVVEAAEHVVHNVDWTYVEDSSDDIRALARALDTARDGAGVGEGKEA